MSTPWAFFSHAAAPSCVALCCAVLLDFQVITIVVAEICGRYNRRLQPRAVPLVITTTVVLSGSFSRKWCTVYGSWCCEVTPT